LIHSQPESFAGYLWSRISPEKQTALKRDWQDEAWTSAKKDLVAALNPILQGLSIYKAEYFKDVQLSTATYNFLLAQPQPIAHTPPPKGPTGDEEFLNRGLIDDYFSENDVVPFSPPTDGQEGTSAKTAKTSGSDEGPDFNYSIEPPDSVKTLTKRKRGFDLESWDEKKPRTRKPGEESKYKVYSVAWVAGGPEKVLEDHVPGAVTTYAPDHLGKLVRISESRILPFPKGAITYYIPEEYANAFFHLCTAVVSRVPTKAGAGQSGTPKGPSTSLLLN